MSLDDSCHDFGSTAVKRLRKRTSAGLSIFCHFFSHTFHSNPKLGFFQSATCLMLFFCSVACLCDCFVVLKLFYE